MTEIPEKAWGRAFNTPLECGIRSAALLLSAYPVSFDLQRLVQYDYLIVHSGDVDGGPTSIHPPTPHRSGELLVRRSLVEHGLQVMAKRMIVETTFTGHGIGYRAGEYAVLFFDSLTTGYARQLRDRAAWVVDRFSEYSDVALGDYMRSRWSRWGSEFARESLFSELNGDY